MTPTNNTGAAQSDVYDGTIQGLRGTSNVDFLYGDNNNNQLEGGPGGDTLDGRLGFDYASYAHASGPVRANLGNQTSNLGEAAGDTYISIEGLRGSDYDDTLIGNNGNNFLAGGPGADYLTGNGGLDTADYYFATSTVFANLGNPASNTGEATGDTYFSIENLRGSKFDDTLRGDGNSNFLDGGPGADLLVGGGGAFRLRVVPVVEIAGRRHRHHGRSRRSVRRLLATRPATATSRSTALLAPTSTTP